MSDEKTFPTRTPDLFAEDSRASHSARRVNSELRTTPATSGQTCLGLSGNAGPIGLLEKTLLASSNWAWTKYSLTWKAKATPQGRLIFQLARLAPRTSGSAYGLLHTPTAKANPTDTGKGDLSLWPTPTAMTGGEKVAPSHLAGKHGWNIAAAVHGGMWPTPRAQEAKHGAATEWELQTDHAGTKDSLRVQVVKRMWPTPRKSMANGPTSREVNSGETKSRLENAVQIWPTPSAQEPGWKNIEVVDKDGNPPSHHNQRFYDKKTGRVVQKGLQQTVTDPKTGGQLNPMWVAWLMGYPLEWLSCVPWETQSSRKSQRK